MILKEIVPGMVIHCKTEEEANTLLSYLDKQGYKWNNSTAVLLGHSQYGVHKEKTCYRILKNCRLAYSDKDWYERNGYFIFEFDALDFNSLSAAEVLEWIAKYYYHPVWKLVFGEDKDIVDTISRNGAEGVIKRIATAWENEQQSKKKEPELEWVNVCRVIKVHDNGRKECVYEEQLAAGSTPGEENILVEAILKKYIMEHEGKYFTKIEHLCREKETDDGVKRD